MGERNRALVQRNAARQQCTAFAIEAAAFETYAEDTDQMLATQVCALDTFKVYSMYTLLIA
jgi:hypothetical protein